MTDTDELKVFYAKTGAEYVVEDVGPEDVDPEPSSEEGLDNGVT